jgi:hypothetical protein
MDGPVVGVSVAQLLYAIGGFVFLSLVGVAVWFLKGIAADFREVARQVQNHDTRIAILEDWRERHEEDHT